MVCRGMKHVGTQVQDGPFVDVPVFVVFLVLVALGFVELQFGVVFDKLGYPLAEAAVLGFDVGFDRWVLVEVAQTNQDVHDHAGRHVFLT